MSGPCGQARALPFYFMALMSMSVWVLSVQTEVPSKDFWVRKKKKKKLRSELELSNLSAVLSPRSLGSFQFEDCTEEVHLSAVLNLRTSEKADRLLCFSLKKKCWVWMQHWVFPNQHQVDDIKTFVKHGTNDRLSSHRKTSSLSSSSEEISNITIN